MTTLDWSCCPAVERVADKVSGAWVFRDTRVPVKSLFENLEDGATVDDFLEWFPGVRRDQVTAVLEFAEHTGDMEHQPTPQELAEEALGALRSSPMAPD